MIKIQIISCKLFNNKLINNYDINYHNFLNPIILQNHENEFTNSYIIFQHMNIGIEKMVTLVIASSFEILNKVFSACCQRLC